MGGQYTAAAAKSEREERTWMAVDISDSMVVKGKGWWDMEDTRSTLYVAQFGMCMYDRVVKFVSVIRAMSSLCCVCPFAFNNKTVRYLVEKETVTKNYYN